jgi:hypothetical protein
MSLDVYLSATRVVIVFSANITHNLAPMAEKAGLYYCIWRPEELGLSKASQLIEPLERGLATLKANPWEYKHQEPAWGTYAELVTFVENYLAACRADPDADIAAQR